MITSGKGKYVISLGAEHTVTFGLVKAHFENYNNLSVLQIDAHSDLRDTYEGNKFSHASVMARVHELGIKIAQVGIRAQDQRGSRADQDLRQDLMTVYAHEIRRWQWNGKMTLSTS